MKIAKLKIKNCGFTLVETILAISVISIAIAAATQLTQSSLKMGRESMNQYVAFHLAEEGLEMVRNLRDSNWLQNKSWRDSIADGTYTIVENTDGPGAPWKLQAVASNASTPEMNKFTRIIEIKTSEAMRVTSRVMYRDGTKEKTVELAAEFTDWKKGPL